MQPKFESALESKFEPRTVVAWKNPRGVRSYGVVVLKTGRDVDIVSVLRLSEGIKCYDEGGSDYRKHRHNVRMRGCPPPLSQAWAESNGRGAYAYAHLGEVIHTTVDSLIMHGVKEDESGVPIPFPTYVDILDHYWREELQRKKDVVYDFWKLPCDKWSITNPPETKFYDETPDGTMYVPDIAGVYRPVGLSYEEKQKRAYSLSLRDDGTEKKYRFIEQDQLLTYLDQSINSGSEIVRGYHPEYDPKKGPDLRRLVRVPEDISIIVPCGETGRFVLQNIDKDDYLDTTDPLRMVGIPASFMDKEYTVFDKYTMQLNFANFQSKSLMDVDPSVERFRNFDESVRWHTNPYFVRDPSERAHVLHDQLSECHSDIVDFSSQIAERSRLERKAAAPVVSKNSGAMERMKKLPEAILVFQTQVDKKIENDSPSFGG